MAFMGVRMSWLILDKNSLLALFARSAVSAARWSRARASCSSVTSVSEKMVFARSARVTGRAVMRSHMARPRAGLSASNSQQRRSPPLECTMAATLA